MKFGNELYTTKKVGVLKKEGYLTNNNQYFIEQYMDINNINECIVVCTIRSGTNETKRIHEKTKGRI